MSIPETDMEHQVTALDAIDQQRMARLILQGYTFKAGKGECVLVYTPTGANVYAGQINGNKLITQINYAERHSGAIAKGEEYASPGNLGWVFE